jgi:hypothetical protein
MTAVLSACGIECHTCPFFEKSCAGCHEVQGRPFWVHEHLGGNPCPIYDCCRNRKGLANSAPCGDLPCGIFREMKDPNSTEEEHLEGIKRRVAALRRPSAD